MNSGCGDPSLQLECDRDVNMALINISGYQYYLWYVPEFRQEHHLKIIEKNLWREGCNPLVRKHITETLSTSLRFNITDDYRNLTLWQGCPSKTIEDKLVSPLQCNYSLQIPVGEELQARGFRIKWIPNETCTLCEVNGGFCAYHINSTQINCDQSKSKSQTWKIILGAIGGTALAKAVVAFFIYKMRRRKASPTQGTSDFSHYQGTEIEGGQKGYMLEYVPNGTLSDHLHGSRRSLRGIPWGTRLKIALQTAQALAYLHSIELPIFHRDVKSNNILLDEHLGAKVADFGLSRLVPVNVSHVTTALQGTPGYVDPEYHQYFQLTEKSDVYSFGVVLVEIISAKVAVDTNRNRNEISLANMATDKIRRGVLDESVDPDLKIETNHEVKAMVATVSELAFECLAIERDFRPSMKEVVARLEQITEMLQQSIESSKLTSISPTASPLSVPIMDSDRS
ncbi:hypothetical protein SUGI_0115930 [Cryptomeria japonica]|nr:hypothetical protein SUGI_0115930 [Cryptomeria japonica]